MKDYSGHFRQLVELQLPGESRILMPRGGREMMILASWRLKNNEFRASKRSKMVRIVISEEAIAEYARGADEVRVLSDARFAAWLRRRLNEFDPNHDSPLGVEPPSVTWNVSTLELNG